jgi:hypothetical protein
VKVDPLHEILEANEKNNSEFEDTIVTVGGASLSAFNQLKITKTQTDPSPAAGDASFTVAPNGILVYTIHVERRQFQAPSSSRTRCLQGRFIEAGHRCRRTFRPSPARCSATGGVVTAPTAP